MQKKNNRSLKFVINQKDKDFYFDKDKGVIYEGEIRSFKTIRDGDRYKIYETYHKKKPVLRASVPAKREGKVIPIENATESAKPKITRFKETKRYYFDNNPMYYHRNYHQNYRPVQRTRGTVQLQLLVHVVNSKNTRQRGNFIGYSSTMRNPSAEDYKTMTKDAVSSAIAAFKNHYNLHKGYYEVSTEIIAERYIIRQDVVRRTKIAREQHAIIRG